MLWFFPELVYFLLFLLLVKYFSFFDLSSFHSLKKELLELKQKPKDFESRSNDRMFLADFSYQELAKIIYESQLISHSTSDKLYFLSDLLSKVSSFHKKNYHILLTLLFRSGVIFILCLLSELVVKAYFYETSGLKKIMIQQGIFFLLSTLSIFVVFYCFKKKQVTSWFFKKSFTTEAHSWVNAYFLGKLDQKAMYYESYRFLEEKMMFSGLSMKQEKKSLLETWAQDKFFCDLEKQNRFFDTLPFYELGLYSGIFVCTFFPHFFLLAKIMTE